MKSQFGATKATLLLGSLSPIVRFFTFWYQFLLRFFCK
jgi:hypothetical protein